MPEMKRDYRRAEHMLHASEMLAAAASVLFVDQSNGDYRFAPGSAGFRYGRYASGGWPTAMGGGMGT